MDNVHDSFLFQTKYFGVSNVTLCSAGICFKFKN